MAARQRTRPTRKKKTLSQSATSRKPSRPTKAAKKSSGKKSTSKKKKKSPARKPSRKTSLKRKDKTPLWSGRFLEVRQVNGWEYVTRKGMTGIVGIVPITPDRKVILIEQHRPPVGAAVIEIPAGLAGDHEMFTGESLLTAAKRELVEETGYEADSWTELVHGYSSAGLTDESLTLFLATNLRKTGDGGGDGHENITVHEVPWDDVPEWLAGRQREGAVVDLKLFAGLYWASRYIG